MNTDKYEGHTPGPWHYHFFDGVDEKYHSVTWGGEFGIQLPVGHSADVKLIAAAPELLAEVKRLRGLSNALWGYICCLDMSNIPSDATDILDEWGEVE